MSHIATEKELARTYNTRSYADAYDGVEDYRRTMRYASRNPNKGSSALSSRLDLPRGRIRSWVDDGSKPDSVRAIEVADGHGWLPLDSQSPVLKPMAELVAWVFSGGSINELWVPSFVCNSRDEQAALRRTLSDIGIGAKIVERGDGRATELIPDQDASVLGRLLSVLGAPVGEKNADVALALPEWLSSVPVGVRVGFAEVYLQNRGHQHEEKDTITFREQRSASYLSELAEFLADVADAPVTVSGKNVAVSAEAARALEVAKKPA